MQRRPENWRKRHRHAELMCAQQKERIRRIPEREEKDHEQYTPEPRAERLREVRRAR